MYFDINSNMHDDMVIRGYRCEYVGYGFFLWSYFYIHGRVCLFGFKNVLIKIALRMSTKNLLRLWPFLWTSVCFCD